MSTNLYNDARSASYPVGKDTSITAILDISSGPVYAKHGLKLTIEHLSMVDTGDTSTASLNASDFGILNK